MRYKIYAVLYWIVLLATLLLLGPWLIYWGANHNPDGWGAAGISSGLVIMILSFSTIVVFGLEISSELWNWEKLEKETAREILADGQRKMEKTAKELNLSYYDMEGYVVPCKVIEDEPTVYTPNPIQLKQDSCPHPVWHDEVLCTFDDTTTHYCTRCGKMRAETPEQTFMHRYWTWDEMR